MNDFYFITHPNVVVSPDVPVPRWPLSDLGKHRMRAGLRQPWVRDITSIYCSTEPAVSVRGWERAVDARARVVKALERIAQKDNGVIAIVAHGAVGTLLYCHLAGEPIARRWDQPPNGGGNYFRFTLVPRAAHSWWQRIDEK